MYAYACSSSAYTCSMHAYAYTVMHTHVRVPEIIKGKFSALKLGFGTNPTSSESCSKSSFSNYKRPYMVSFQDT